MVFRGRFNALIIDFATLIGFIWGIEYFNSVGGLYILESRPKVAEIRYIQPPTVF
jgi:hypothetical protein